MFARYATLGLVLASLFYIPTSASEAASMSRREIRSMPIVQRPSRPGHFYGNAVRRNYARSSSGSW